MMDGDLTAREIGDASARKEMLRLIRSVAIARLGASQEVMSQVDGIEKDIEALSSDPAFGPQPAVTSVTWTIIA